MLDAREDGTCKKKEFEELQSFKERSQGRALEGSRFAGC
jgi:hypothetical protein